MRVAIVIHSMAAGGAERVSAQLANYWEAAGNEVHLITDCDADGDFYQLSASVKRHSLSLAKESANLTEAIKGNLKRVRALRELFKRIRPDNAVAMMTGAAVTTLLASRGLRIRVIVSERSYPPCYPLGRIWEWLRRQTYPWAYRVVMQTEEGLIWLKRTIPKARGLVVPNPVSHPLPTGAPIVHVANQIPADAKMLLAVGRLDKDKQFDHVLAAFSRAAKKYTEWYLVILGEGPERTVLMEAIARHPFVNRIRMPGRIGNMSDWYERADLYVMSSRFEGFPNTLSEAMAHGCAAISYDCDTGPRDIIRHAVDGLLVRPVGDSGALSEALDSLMGDEARRHAMGKKAMEVRSRFSQKRIFSLWRSIMKDEPPQNCANFN